MNRYITLNERLYGNPIDLNESIRDVKNKYRNHPNLDDFINDIKSIDPTSSFKYALLIADALENGYDEDIIETTVKKLDTALNLKRLPNINNDVSRIKSFEDVLGFIDDIDIQSKTSKRQTIKEEGAEIIFENDQCIVRKITSANAANIYGAGTKWCISARDNGEEYWKTYVVTQGMNYFYFFESKILPSSDPNYKIAVGVGIDINTGKRANEYRNALDVYIFDPRKILMGRGYKLSKDLVEELIKPDENKVKFRLDIPTNKIVYNEVPGKKLYQLINNIEDFVKDGKFIAPFDESIEYKGNINCKDLGLKSLIGCPIVVRGDFSCYDIDLETLEGAPEKVYGRFDCSRNKLTSLKGAPKMILDNFYCSGNYLTNLDYFPSVEPLAWIVIKHNRLTSLEGIRSFFKGVLDCSNNNLTSLKGCPQQLKYFNCSRNKLTSLDYGPGQDSIVGNYVCSYNKLTSLKGGPKNVNNFDCSNNKLTSLKDAPGNVKNIDCSNNEIESFKDFNMVVDGDFIMKNNKYDIDYDEILKSVFIMGDLKI